MSADYASAAGQGRRSRSAGIAVIPQGRWPVRLRRGAWPCPGAGRGGRAGRPARRHGL